jgi:glycosyltransferase involved in cell wall biosynthesis
MVEGVTHQQVGYILRSYPRLSQTFILNEILNLERLGMSLEIFALTDPHEDLHQSNVSDIRAQVHYFEPESQQGRVRHWFRHLAVLLSHPLRYGRSWLFVLRNRHLDEGYRTATRFECFSMAVFLVWQIENQPRQTGGRISHLHAHFAHDPALIALLAHKISGISYSFTAHARDLYQLAVPALQERSKWASAVVTCCAANRDYLGQVLPEPLQAKIQLVHHGVDLQVFSPLPVEPPPPAAPEPSLILTVGRLVEKKGFPVLLEAYQRLKLDGIAFRALVYGDGPLCQELSALLDQYDLDDRVDLVGARVQQEIIPMYQKAAVFALTPAITDDGDRDGIPNVLVEAMACGLPVVTTAVAGIPELVIHNHNGLLFQPHDAQGIAAGLAALLGDQDLCRRLGQAARRTVMECFDSRVGASRMADLFRQIRTA